MVDIKDKFINSSISLITKYNFYSKDDIDKLKYGLEGLYLTISKTVIIILLALIIGIVKEVVIVILLFNFIRYFGFGFHASNSYQCLLFSTFCFIIIPTVIINIKISNIGLIVICLICIINYILFAPADTVKRPLPNKKKRIIRKIITVSMGLIYSFMIFILNNDYYTSLLLSAMIIETIVINPLTYKLFKQPYKNYLNYSYA